MRIFIFIFAFIPIVLFSQNVGINTDGSTPDPSALLDVKSTTQGMLVPRLTSAQRNVIAAPATGLLVFDTTLGAFHFYDGAGWQNLSAGGVLSDADGDTKIAVEQNPDEDVVRITAGGNEIVTFHSDRIDMNSDDDNTILGEDAAENISQANLSTIIGARAGRNYTGDYGVFVGVDAYKETQGQYNTAIGYQTAANDTFGFQNTFLGAEAGKNNHGAQSVFIGIGAGINNDARKVVSIGMNAGAENKGYGNIFIGANAGKVSTGFDNLFIGENAGLLNTNGSGNTYIGHNAGKAGNDYSNVHIGSDSGEKSTGFGNIIIGSRAASNSINGYNSVIIGTNAAIYDTASRNNVIIGERAGAGGSSSSFMHMKKESVLIGERAGYSLQGNGNTAVGYRAGQNATGSSNVFIGREAGGLEEGDSKLYISNSSTSVPLIYGEFNNGLVKINDKLEVKNDKTTSGSRAIFGQSTYLIGTNYGGHFIAAGSSGFGVKALASGLNGTGLSAESTGNNGTGLFAEGGYRAAVFQGEVETNGHLHINAPVNDAQIFMTTSTGNETRVMVKQNGTEDIYLGDLDTDGGDVFIRANGDDRLVVRQDGSVEIKDPTDPTLTFERTSSGSYDAQIITGSSSNIYFKNGGPLGSLENSMIIRNDGEVRIYHSDTNGEGLRLQNRTNNKSWSLYTDELASANLHLYAGTSLVGNFNAASGVYTSTSDRRRKEKIVNLGNVMEKVQKLQIKKYRFRNQLPSDPESIGLIAQDVKLLFPEFVAYDEDTDTYTMDYAGLSSIALKAIQEQNELIVHLQEQIDALKTKQ